MVDARLTPLAAMGLDRGSLMHDGLRLHGGVVYPGIRALPEKSRETPTHSLTYNRDGLPELIYKPDGSMDSRKPANGYLGLYKGTHPSLHKPVMVPGAEGLGLERRLGPGEKASELCLASAGGSYLRLPWFSPYPEASMYPFMDTSKYAALNMYKASLLSQPNPYLPQHLAYPSLCAAQGGNVNPAAAVSAAERLYYMPHYPPSPLSSPLVAPPMRIPAVTVAPTSLVHCQDKGHGVPPPFAQQLQQPSPHPQHHQAAIDRDRSPSRSSRPSRPPSRKGSSNNNNSSTSSTSGTNGGNSNSLPTDSSSHASSRLPQPPPSPALIDSSLDIQRPVARIGQPPTSSSSSVSSSSSSTQSIPHLFSVSSMASEQPSPSPHKSRPRDGAPEQRSAGVERRPSRSPSKPNFERPAHQPQATKDSAEKPLDLSGRILEFGLPPNGFPVKMDTIASNARYGLPPSRELLKENLSLSPSSHPHPVVSSTSTKVSERPEMISTLHSSWVVPSPSPSHTQHTPGLPPSPRPNADLGLSKAKGSSPSVIKHKGLERVHPQQRSSSCPRTGEPNHNVSSTQHSGSSLVNSRSLSPKPHGEWVKHSPSQSEHPSVGGHHREGTEKSSLTTKRGETTAEVPSYKRPCLENGHPPSHLYLPQNDAYLNHSLAYANRYLHYPIPDGMALHSLPITGKGPVYHHPVMLGSNSLYPTHLTAKHPLPYHNLPGGPGGEYLTYNSQEMAHPLMQTHTDNKLPERGDSSLKPRVQEKSRGAVEECGGHRDHNIGKETGEGSQIKHSRDSGAQGQCGGQSRAPSSTSKENIVCIDLVHSDTDIESTPTIHKQPFGETSTKVNQNECCHSNQNLTKMDYEPNQQHHLSHTYQVHSGQSPTLKPSHTDRQPEPPFGKTKVIQDTDYPGMTSSTSPTTPGQIAQAEESLEERSPSPDPGDQDQSTLRCARTSGERSSGKGKGDRDSRALYITQHCTDVVKESDQEEVCERDTDREDSIVDLGESQGEGDEEDEDGSQTSSKDCRRSSLAKRIANSTGYVGDRFKCVTTELYADSSKLSREQRALQMEVISREGSNISQPAANWERAMMRFSELELKEKEGGGVCVSASAAGRELADGQRRERALEYCQHTTRQGEREGVPPAYTNNRVPVLQRCGGQREPLSLGQGAGGLKDGTKKFVREHEGGHCLPPTLTPVKGYTEEKASPGFGPTRKRPLFIKTEQDDTERDEGERLFHPEKRPRICTDEREQASPDEEEEDDEVRKLKVCIELKGLRLSKPATGAASPEIKQERPWPQPRLVAQAQSPRERKIRAGEPEERAAAQRAEINRKWGCEKLLNGVSAPPLPPSQLKDRAYPPDPFSGDRGLKEPRRGPPSPAPELSVGGTPPLKPRRHSDTDKPKGKRPCKTKHTSQREREKRKDATPISPGQQCVADLGAAEEDKLSEQRCAPRKRAASPNHYPCSPVKPCSPAALCPPSLQPQVNGRAASVPPEAAQGLHRTPPAEPPAVRPIPPEARRLIVNKNAGETLLQRAARLGYEEVVLYCLENRVCEVNHRDYAGYCALHEACARGWLNIVQHLLDYGADINCSAQDGTRPIHDAVENDHLDVVRVLLSYGADPTLATYSGRGLLKMTHSDSMERFLTDYFADLQGRLDDDPGLYWEFYGSAVCESSEEGGIYDILADPPGPEDEDEDDKREVFEFEFSDRPLLPCYNIQVSLSQGPRNWLLLSDVLRRLRMSGRGFRQAFPHMEVVTVAEAEFYQQASLSQLFSCPEELEGFHPDSKELLDLVEDSAELAALLGSTLECLDDRWDHPGDRLKDKIKAVGKLGSS
ncbi:BCL-6 corepressor isoform X1 [Hippoglossus stenolepis]|uniref:BCL-6 corepressor isoform X1 n=1 Tax=Hippoglossus stenolepis TaxID=195615 RepID=UPI00159C0421|nr:BCL-6 corepressor isoform X1 [Hippoglossus stenolepis]XP_035030951.1 BCL-6 corepressor isoform X1 [Hippoglossus stenolepis]